MSRCYLVTDVTAPPERGRSLLPASEAPNARALTIADTLTLHDGETVEVWCWIWEAGDVG